MSTTSAPPDAAARALEAYRRSLARAWTQYERAVNAAVCSYNGTMADPDAGERPELPLPGEDTQAQKFACDRERLLAVAAELGVLLTDGKVWCRLGKAEQGQVKAAGGVVDRATRPDVYGDVDELLDEASAIMAQLVVCLPAQCRDQINTPDHDTTNCDTCDRAARVDWWRNDLLREFREERFKP